MSAAKSTPSQPGMRAGLMTRERGASTGPGTATAMRVAVRPWASSCRVMASRRAVRTRRGPSAMLMGVLVGSVIPVSGSVSARSAWWAPSSMRAPTPPASAGASMRARRPPVETDSSVSLMTPESTRRETAAEMVEAASPVRLTMSARVRAWPEPMSAMIASSTL